MSTTITRQENDTKVCPVCHALCFADMDTCYGCLHTFSPEDALRDTGKFKVVCNNENDASTHDLPSAAIIPVDSAPECADDLIDKLVFPSSSAISENTHTEEDALRRTQKTIRLNELLEIVISVRMAQDAKEAALKQDSLV